MHVNTQYFDVTSKLLFINILLIIVVCCYKWIIVHIEPLKAGPWSHLHQVYLDNVDRTNYIIPYLILNRKNYKLPIGIGIYAHSLHGCQMFYRDIIKLSIKILYLH